MILEDYVSFETAKLLKEHGFNEYCEMFYIKPHEGYMQNKKKLDWRNSELRKDMTCTCPTIQMAMKWLREEHGIDIDICFEILSIHQYANNEQRYSYTIFKTKDNVATRLYGDSGYMKYEEAAEAALNLCLRKLNDII